MNYKIMVLALLILAGTGTDAQKLDVQLAGGYQRTYLHDQQASPLTYWSSEKTGSLRLSYTEERDRLRLDLGGGWGSFFPQGHRDRKWYDTQYGSNGPVKTDSLSILGTLYNGGLKLAYLHAVKDRRFGSGSRSLRQRLFLGGSVNDQLFYSDNIVRAGWLNAASLNADLEYELNGYNKHTLLLSAAAPLVARNTRLPYHNTVSSSKGEDGISTVLKQGSRFAWPGDFQNVQLRAAYHYALSHSFSLGLQYSGQWLRYAKEQPVRLFQNNVGLVASFH